MLTSERVRVSPAIDTMYEELYDLGWTDGLPIIPPTEERVQAFVDYLGRDPREVVVEEIPPDKNAATIEAVAINAVMAGCRPEYMPVILAAIEAVTEPDWRLETIQVTTNPATPFVIVNGPIRHHLKINCGVNCLGQGWRANATIGRAINLALRNIGGAVPGEVSKSTQGQPGRFTMCIGENEEDSPWEPLHVERGFSKEQSTVTVLPAAGNMQLYAGTRGADRCLTIIAHSLTAMGTNNMMIRHAVAGPDAPGLLLCPPHAQMCAEAGYSKKDVKRILWERGRVPIEWFPEDEAERKRAGGLVFDGMVPLLGDPDELVIVVAGGLSGLHSTFVPTMGARFFGITKLIKL